MTHTNTHTHTHTLTITHILAHTHTNIHTHTHTQTHTHTNTRISHTCARFSSFAHANMRAQVNSDGLAALPEVFVCFKY